MITTMTTTPPAMAATMIMLISSSSSSTTLSAVPTVLISGLPEVVFPAVVVAGALVVEFDVVSGTKRAWSVILTCLTTICIDWFKILLSEHSDLAYPANVTTKKPTSRSLHIGIMMCVIVKKIIILGQAEMRSFNLCSCASEHIYRYFFFSLNKPGVLGFGDVLGICDESLKQQVVILLTVLHAVSHSESSHRISPVVATDVFPGCEHSTLNQPSSLGRLTTLYSVNIEKLHPNSVTKITKQVVWITITINTCIYK